MSAGGPLAGFRILEISQMLAGPYCGMLLADLGAEVVKIETGEGDIARRTGRHERGGHNLYFASLNRNKKSVLLDLTDPADRRVFDGLVAVSHGLVTNLRPRAIKKLGLTYAALKAHNRNLACLAITGFGLDGPYSDHPAYDYIIQAAAGVMMLTGEPGGPPMRAGYSVVDNTGGMMGALGLTAQLLSRRGGQVDVALFDTLLSQLNYLGSAYLNAGEAPQRHSSGAHSFFVPAQIFETADGHLALFITHDSFWREFCQAVSKDDWLTDARFATMRARSENREVVISAVCDLLKRDTTDAWIRLLQPRGVVAGAVGDLASALAHPSVQARAMVARIATPAGAIELIGNPIKTDAADDSFAPPPKLGEHTDIYRALAAERMGK